MLAPRTSAPDWLRRLSLPAIAAPMTAVSGPELVTAAVLSGIVGSFPTHNAPSSEALDEWLVQIEEAIGSADGCAPAPVAPNLVVHSSNRRLSADVELLVRHRVKLVITSVGSPAEVVAPLHEAGAAVLADVATMRHVDRAIAAGVDGLVLLSAGAGGQTGTANPFAFVRAVRRRFDGLIVLAGGISDGAGIAASQVLGADLVYLGTRLIATEESLAGERYRAALIRAEMDDVRLTSEVSGIPASFLASWLEEYRAQEPATPPGGRFHHERLLRRTDGWSAGHGVGAVTEVATVGTVVADLKRQYESAWADFDQRAPTTTDVHH